MNFVRNTRLTWFWSFYVFFNFFSKILCYIFQDIFFKINVFNYWINLFKIFFIFSNFVNFFKLFTITWFYCLCIKLWFFSFFYLFKFIFNSSYNRKLGTKIQKPVFYLFQITSFCIRWRAIIWSTQHSIYMLTPKIPHLFICFWRHLTSFFCKVIKIGIININFGLCIFHQFVNTFNFIREWISI